MRETDMSLEGRQVAGPRLSEEIRRQTAVNVARCYQCGKCSAGCPLSADMDFPPSVILRMVQTGDPDLEKEVVGSHAVWLCLSCETCSVRCPMDIDLPRVMDTLRRESLRTKNVHPRARDIIAFHRSFLDSIRHLGRLYEVGLIVGYKARSRHLFQDVLLAPLMYVRGKLHLVPGRIRGRRPMRRIFSRTLKRKEPVS
jgi:heterodisulfide reductase subunit C2